MSPSTTSRERLLVVSPVHDEAAHLDRTAAAVAAQARPPDRWIVVDDGSTDGTLAIARRWERRLPYLTVLRADDAVGIGAGMGGDSHADGLTLARDARAFNLGLRAAGWRDYTHVGKLDGDVELPPGWFADLLARFRDDPALGVAGGRLREPRDGGWRLIPIPSSHVHGAVKLYRRECLAAIGGIPERLGWDTIDETYARLRGYATHSPDELVARHHRPWGSAGGRLRGRARHGACAWILHQPVGWAVLRAAKLAAVPPVGLSGLAFLYGYARAAATGTARVEDPRFRRLVRRELRGRVRAVLPLRPPDPAPVQVRPRAAR